MRSIEPVSDGRRCLFRITEADREKLEKHLYQRYPNREWGTYFRFGFRRTAWGLALSYVEPILPGPGDLDRQSGITTFRDQYSFRAFREAERRELGIGVVHSHPQGCGTFPSTLDDDMDTYYGREFSAFSGGFPYCSLIFQRSAEGIFTFTGRVLDRGEWLPVTEMLTTGFPLRRELSEEFSPAACDRSEIIEGESPTARLDSLLEEQGSARLSGATIGVVGCSGTGSPAIHVLARARVGGLVVVDPQRLSASNLERLHGSVREDLKGKSLPLKVEIMRRLVASINPTSRVTALAGNILQEDVLDWILLCDLVLGCSDTQHARVMLSDAAKHYLLPVLDVGVAMDGQGGRISSQICEITQYAPELPCAFCGSRIDPAQLAAELMSDEERTNRIEAAALAQNRGEKPDQYWRGETRQFSTVGYLTSALGSLAAAYAEAWLTGAFGEPASSFQFDIGQPKFGFAEPIRTQLPECPCTRGIGWADQARKWRNVARPNHWPKRALRL